MRNAFKPLKKDIFKELIANAAMGIPAVRRWRIRRGRTNFGTDTGGKFASQLREFLEIAGRDCLCGKSVLEVGPGDLIAMGLLFLGAGAKRYSAVDRFLGDVLSAALRPDYAAVFQAAPDWIKEGIRQRGLDAAAFPWTKGLGADLIGLYTASLEQAGQTVPPADVLCSFNVVEELYDLDRAFAAARRMLRPGGFMAHRVDYTPHGCWTNYANPLTFLTVGERLWQAMGSRRGVTNRLRHCQVIASLQRCGFECQSTVVSRFDPKHVEEIRPLLPASQRELPMEDLLVAEAWIVAR